MSEEDWEVPAQLQPDPDDYSFDLDTALRAVVGIKSIIPHDAFTAGTLGTERVGNGTVIDAASGLILTIGYLITEAETIWLTGGDGRAVQGHALAVDQETGFGLVQPLGRLDLPALEFADSEKAGLGAPAIMAASGGRPHAVETRIVGRQEFAGYWEYVLEDAIFVAPAHPFWGGTALIGADGSLLGVGSLILQQGDARGRRLDMNMVVPIQHLTPILNDLLMTGCTRRAAKPWLGLYATEAEEQLLVGGLARGGPAERAGVQTGDRIIAVGDERVNDLATLWRGVWASGGAGVAVSLRLEREGATLGVTVTSADRRGFLKGPRLH
jgi:S1-C subfamily serine protease